MWSFGWHQVGTAERQVRWPRVAMAASGGALGTVCGASGGGGPDVGAGGGGGMTNPGGGATWQTGSAVCGGAATEAGASDGATWGVPAEGPDMLTFRAL